MDYCCNTFYKQTKASLINSKLSKKNFSFAQLNPKVSRRKEIIKIRAEITEKEIKAITAKINKTKIWLFEKINKIDEPFPDSSRKKGKRIKSAKLKMKMEKSQQTTQKYKGS